MFWSGRSQLCSALGSLQHTLAEQSSSTGLWSPDHSQSLTLPVTIASFAAQHTRTSFPLSHSTFSAEALLADYCHHQLQLLEYLFLKIGVIKHLGHLSIWHGSKAPSMASHIGFLFNGLDLFLWKEICFNSTLFVLGSFCACQWHPSISFMFPASPLNANQPLRNNCSQTNWMPLDSLEKDCLSFEVYPIMMAGISKSNNCTSFALWLQHLMCAGLWCLVEGDTSCKTKLDPPLDGTECGADKVIRMLSSSHLLFHSIGNNVSKMFSIYHKPIAGRVLGCIWGKRCAEHLAWHLGSGGRWGKEKRLLKNFIASVSSSNSVMFCSFWDIICCVYFCMYFLELAWFGNSSPYLLVLDSNFFFVCGIVGEVRKGKIKKPGCWDQGLEPLLCLQIKINNDKKNWVLETMTRKQKKRGFRPFF